MDLIFTPLDHTKRQLRLFKFKDTQDDVIECVLSNHGGDTTPPYTTLSCTWEPKYPLRKILINGRTLIIGDNLWQFLRTVRHDGQTYFWIDQICIDQDNIAERNHQVGMMSDIYQHSRGTIVWLGTDDDDSRVAFDYMRKIASANLPFVLPFSHGASGGLYEYIEHFLASLRAVFRHQYWQRVWIVQEIIFSKRIWIRCGTEMIRWEELYDFTHLLMSQENHPVPQHVQSIVTTKGEWGRGTPWPKGSLGLREVLYAYRNSQCTNPLDKVYGLLGLINDDEQVDVDYPRTPFELFVHTLDVRPRYSAYPPDDADILQQGLILWDTMHRSSAGKIRGSIQSDRPRGEQRLVEDFLSDTDVRWLSFDLAETFSKVRSYRELSEFMTELFELLEKDGLSDELLFSSFLSKYDALELRRSRDHPKEDNHIKSGLESCLAIDTTTQEHETCLCKGSLPWRAKPERISPPSK